MLVVSVIPFTDTGQKLCRDVKLLSFGGDEGEEEEQPVIFRKKPIVRPDCQLVFPKLFDISTCLHCASTVSDGRAD